MRLWKTSLAKQNEDIVGVLAFDGHNYYVNNCIILKSKVECLYKVGNYIIVTEFSLNNSKRSKQYQYFANSFTKAD
jgi:hypothetical protein